MNQLSLSPYRSFSKSFELFIQISEIPIQLFEPQDSNQYHNTLKTQNEQKITDFTEIAQLLPQIYNKNDKNNKNIQNFTTKQQEKLAQSIIEAHLELIQIFEQNHSNNIVILEKILPCFQILSQFVQQIEKLENFNAYKISLMELIVYESISLIWNFKENAWLKKFSQKDQQIVQILQQFQIRIETLPFLQQFLFNHKMFKQPFLTNFPSKNEKLFTLFEQNVETFRNFAILNGGMKASYIQFQGNTEKTQISEFLPVSLLPMKVQKNKIVDLLEKTQVWQKLINKMAFDYPFINQVFSNIQDDFVKRLLQLQQKTLQSVNANKTNFTIIRNDYMLDSYSDQWLQVEFNTLSAGLVHISDTVQDLQESLINSHLQPQQLNLQNQQKSIVQTAENKFFKSQNDNLAGEGFEQAHKLYGNPNAKVLYMVGKNEWNMYDQRHSEFYLAKKGILSLRKTFEEMIQESTLDKDGRLFVNGDEIALVYWRWGYSPNHYYSEDIWKIREQIEISRAIKCPNISLILINFKKIQLELQKNNLLNKYLTDSEADLIKQNFAEIKDFEDESKNQEIMELVKQNPDLWVLKPQREGGGNNIYGEEIYEHLSKLDLNGKRNYILMQKIISRPRVGYMMTPKTLEMHGVVSEISTWGYFISEMEGDKDKDNNNNENQIKILQNVKGGYLNRTKKYTENEGGLAVGLSVLDGFMYEQE